MCKIQFRTHIIIIPRLNGHKKNHETLTIRRVNPYSQPDRFLRLLLRVYEYHQNGNVSCTKDTRSRQTFRDVHVLNQHMFRWVPEETQECKDNVDECVDVTKPFCREVEITLRDILMPKQFAKSLAAGGGPRLQGEADLPLGTKVYN